MKEIFEIRIHARAGQGSNTLAQLIAEAAANNNYHIQAFPSFGPVRSGAPMDAYVRISKNIINIHTPVKKPDLLIILDETLMLTDDIGLILNNNQLLLNTAKSKESIIKNYKIKSPVYVVNANKIAQNIFKKVFINTVMLGAYAKTSKKMSLKEAKMIVKNKFEKKYGRLIAQINSRAVEEGYEQTL